MKTKKLIDIWDKIDALIGEEIKPKQSDEFTLYELIARLESNGHKTGYSTTDRKVKTLVANGVLTARKTNVNGKQSNVYRFV